MFEGSAVQRVLLAVRRVLFVVPGFRFVSWMLIDFLIFRISMFRFVVGFVPVFISFIVAVSIGFHAIRWCSSVSV